eukprot:CAMPEP_0176001622 /NCGR_PEP_ID=MMETSP0120_2-20121206/221_1 /TAXON_ID=160619 /ORGANISM="Kryptoperidinium foliaceum, Strain CCMP 1326" /LENGTH=46 /DNA_ID= /DNA_START= /DNA_END= /DNA_ORIENTATION=
MILDKKTAIWSPLVSGVLALLNTRRSNLCHRGLRFFFLVMGPVSRE